MTPRVVRNVLWRFGCRSRRGHLGLVHRPSTAKLETSRTSLVVPCAHEVGRSTSCYVHPLSRSQRIGEVADNLGRCTCRTDFVPIPPPRGFYRIVKITIHYKRLLMFNLPGSDSRPVTHRANVPPTDGRTQMEPGASPESLRLNSQVLSGDSSVF
jgi:hypothetical protein